MTRSNFIKSRLIAGPPSLPWTLVLGPGFVIAPTFLRLAADPIIHGTPFATYYPFVLLAALFIGSRGAAVVAVAASLIANFLFMEPRYVLFATVSDTGGVILFLVSSFLIIFAVDTLRRAVLDLESASQREADLNAQLRHLNGELGHRVKNTLAVVQALATHTFRGLPDGNEAVRKFHGRLHALAEAQAVLVSGSWEDCQLPDLAVRALAPFNGQGAVRLSGPPCRLPQLSCVPLVLALHELGTNALKYGALSTLDGVVEVHWHVRDADGGATAPQLVLDWRETGGPLVEMPTRRGLGSRLVAAQPGIDSATMDFRPEGLSCRVVAGGVVPISVE